MNIQQDNSKHKKILMQQIKVVNQITLKKKVLIILLSIMIIMKVKDKKIAKIIEKYNSMQNQKE